MALASGAVAVLEAAWLLSTRLVPVVFLAFLLLVPRMNGSLAARVVASQRDATLRYGLHLTAGFLTAGAVRAAVPGTAGFVIAVGVVAAAGLYAYRTCDDITATEPGDGWRGRLALLWLAVPVLAAAALATQHVLLTRITALIFYSTIFWVI